MWRGVFCIFEDRFLMLSGYAPGGISGCAVDSSVRVFKQLQAEGLDGLERSQVYFRAEDGSIQAVHFTEFNPPSKTDKWGLPLRSSTPISVLSDSSASKASKAVRRELARAGFSLPQNA